MLINGNLIVDLNTTSTNFVSQNATSYNQCVTLEQLINTSSQLQSSINNISRSTGFHYQEIVFTSNGSYDLPNSSSINILVSISAGGGGGAGGKKGSNNNGGGGGGAGESYIDIPLPISSNTTSLNIFVGSGGLGGATNSNGANGGPSYITDNTNTTLIYTNGGSGGQSNGTGGQGYPNGSDGSPESSGAGASSLMGVGGSSISRHNVLGNNAYGYGAGGSGSINSGGGNGSPGIVILKVFYTV